MTTIPHHIENIDARIEKPEKAGCAEVCALPIAGSPAITRRQSCRSNDHPCTSVGPPLFSSIESMSLDPPTYLSSLENNIRARPIPWEGAVRAGTITENDLKTIKSVDKVRKEQRRQTVESDLEAYQSLILGGSKGKSVLVSASKRTDVIQYMLVLAGDLINGGSQREK